MALVLLSATSLSATVARLPGYTGVQLHSLWHLVTFAQMRSDLRQARSIGANVVRVDVGWATLLQDGPYTFDPSSVKKLDTFVRWAGEDGMKVIATVQTTPCWASSAPAELKEGCRGSWWDRNVEFYPPKHPTDYGNFVRWLTRRYRGELAAVEIWNEPDQHGFWNTSAPAADYAALLKAAYPAAKQGDPHVPVLAGSLSGADLPFLGQLYQDGIIGSYDGLAIHPYCFPRPPDLRVAQGDDPRWAFASGLAAIHAAQERAGDRAKLWLTEFGWPTGNTSREVSGAEQAQYIDNALHLAGGMSYVRAATVYELHDEGNSPSNWWDNFGLLNADRTPKPAFFAFARATAGQ